MCSSDLRETYPRIAEVWTQGDAVLDALRTKYTAPLGRDGVLLVDATGVRMPNGLYLRYPNLRKERDPRNGRMRTVYDTKRGKATIAKPIWGGGLTENWCQGLARIIVAEQMLMIARRYKVAMTVHDSVVAVVPMADGDDAREWIETCMRIRPKWALGLPLNCESKMGASYGG